MKKLLSTLVLSTLLVTTSKAQVPADVKTTEGGVRYKIYTKNNEKAKKLKSGDIIEYHMMLSDPKNEVYKNTFKKEMGLIKLPQLIKGEIVEALLQSHAGDSLSVWMSVEALKRKLDVDKFAPGTDLKYTFKIGKILSPEDLKKKHQERIAKQKKIDNDIIFKHLKDNKIKAQFYKGIYYTVSKSTKKPEVKANQEISVHYRLKRMTSDGKILDKTIDSSYGRNKPFKFTVGRGKVIKGWDIGFTKLKRGEKATLYIPSWLAYGARKKSNQIPANAILVFDVFILK